MSIFTLIVAFAALAVSLFTFWLSWWKPFKLNIKIRAVIWRPPLNGRSDTLFSLTTSLIVQNMGARPGLVEAAYVRLIPQGDREKEYRLEAIAIEDASIMLQTWNAEEETEKARALLGLAGFLVIDKYEVKETGIRFSFPPVDAERYYRFLDPKNVWMGDYNLELWCRVDDVWTCFVRDHVISLIRETLETVRAGNPVINVVGGVYDTAPGAPLGPDQPEARSDSQSN